LQPYPQVSLDTVVEVVRTIAVVEAAVEAVDEVTDEMDEGVLVSAVAVAVDSNDES
jgi:hypothetical protein